MMAHTNFDEEFTNNEIFAAKKLLAENQSVHRVAEAVDTILPLKSEQEYHHHISENDLRQFQVVAVCEMDNDRGNYNISLPESFAIDGSSTVVEWDDIEKNYHVVENEAEVETITPDVIDELCLGPPAPAPRRVETPVATPEEDPEDSNKNLGWLLNFRIESLCKPLDAVSQNDCDCKIFVAGYNGALTGSCRGCGVSRSSSTTPRCERKNCGGDGSSPVADQGRVTRHPKPPFTYTELIEQALSENGELTVSGIYKWISKNFPFFQPEDDRWKNSVRHNLSINPHFSKGGKARKGAGHLWTVVTGEDRSRTSWKRRRLEQFVIDQKRRDAAAAAEEQSSEVSEAVRRISEEEECLEHEEEGWETIQVISLEQTAGDILAGVKRDVEVEYLAAIPAEDEAERSCGSADSDFLNPVPKHEAVKESGLLSDDFPEHLHHTGTGGGDDPFFSDEEMTLQYYELALAAQP